MAGAPSDQDLRWRVLKALNADSVYPAVLCLAQLTDHPSNDVVSPELLSAGSANIARHARHARPPDEFSGNYGRRRRRPSPTRLGSPNTYNQLCRLDSMSTSLQRHDLGWNRLFRKIQIFRSFTTKSKSLNAESPVINCCDSSLRMNLSIAFSPKLKRGIRTAM